MGAVNHEASVRLVRWRPQTDGWLCQIRGRVDLPFKVAVTRNRLYERLGYGRIVLAIDHQ
jgi:hypothetical protein